MVRSVRAPASVLACGEHPGLHETGCEPPLVPLGSPAVVAHEQVGDLWAVQDMDSGRGIHIVKALASARGALGRPPGKIVPVRRQQGVASDPRPGRL